MSFMVLFNLQRVVVDAAAFDACTIQCSTVPSSVVVTVSTFPSPLLDAWHLLCRAHFTFCVIHMAPVMSHTDMILVL